jgi:hypothetical protein
MKSFLEESVLLLSYQLAAKPAAVFTSEAVSSVNSAISDFC